MPSITKAEHVRLKEVGAKYEWLKKDHIKLTLKYLQALQEAEKWKRYYNAVRETFKVEESVEIPGCFNPTDTIQYIVKKQEEGA